MTAEELTKLVEQHVSQLREHCDSVQIFVTMHNSETEATSGIGRGSGNCFARIKQCEDWAYRMDENVEAQRADQTEEELE